MSDEFDGSVVLVTGGADGIGCATARAFLERGARVEIWDVNREAGEWAVKSWLEEGWKAEFTQVDASQAGQVERAMQELAGRCGRLDVLVNNAGITRDATLLKMDSAQWDQVLSVNLSGVFHCGQAAARVMASQGSGVILNASSVVAHRGNFGQSNYVAAKAGVIGLTQTWARELGRKGIRVNAVAPGFIETRMVDTVPDKILDGLRERTPLGRLGRAEDIAHAYVFLASPGAAFITGAVLNVDGGLVF